MSSCPLPPALPAPRARPLARRRALRLRALPAVLVAIGLVFSSVASVAPARAQGTPGNGTGTGATINVVQEASLPRETPTGQQVTKRPLTLEPEGVSLQDCLDDQRIVFPLQLAGFVPEATLEAWAGLSGADCGVQTNRQSGTQVCWRLTSGLPLQLTTRVPIPVRTIMSGTIDPKAPITDQSVCGRVDLTTISVQFLYFAPGQLATPATKKDLQVRVDTIGPAAPGNVSVAPGNTRLRISFGGLGEGGLTQFTGVRAYCDPALENTVTDAGAGAEAEGDACIPPSEVEAGDDGDADAEITDGAVICDEAATEEAGTDTQPTTCESPNLAPPGGERIIPNDAFNDRFLCGSLTGNTGSGLIADSVGGKPLVNGRNYAVALAATDRFGNLGPLSTIFCATPEPTSDFWETYKNAGGGAGGGVCSVEGGLGFPVGSLSVMSIFGLALVGMLRRNRRTRPSRDTRSPR